MTSPLRQLAYRYRWIYDTVTGISALSVGGVDQLRRLGLSALDPRLPRGAKVLDLCCGSGAAAAPWIEAGFQVTGLDVSPKVLELAATRQPLLTCIEGLAEAPPCSPAAGRNRALRHEFGKERLLHKQSAFLRRAPPAQT